jgi:hypothetical protein
MDKDKGIRNDSKYVASSTRTLTLHHLRTLNISTAWFLFHGVQMNTIYKNVSLDCQITDLKCGFIPHNFNEYSEIMHINLHVNSNSYLQNKTLIKHGQTF